jgi:hypothetical protein
VHVEIGRQRVSNEAEWLRGRIGKEEPPCPRLLLAEVQTDPCEGDFPDGDFRATRGCTSNSGPAHIKVPGVAIRAPIGKRWGTSGASGVGLP